MPYDKETRDALQAYYETHDFTGNIPAFDDKKYTPAQLRIYVKAKKFFAQSWLKLLPETGNKRSMRNFSKNYPLNCLKEGDAAYIADMVAEIMDDEKQFKASIDKFFSDLQEPLETGLSACAKAHGKIPEELTDEEIEDVVDKLAGLFMEEMINALMTAQKTPEIFAALHKGDTKLTVHEDFNDSVCENHDKINFLKRWTHSDTQLGAALSLEEVMATDRDAVENAADFFSPAESRNPEEKTLMWFCRPHGTHCLNENQVFIQGTRDHNTFRFYAEQTYDECVARVIVPKAVKRGKVFGDVFEVNYREQAANVAQNSVAPDHDRLTFADGFVLDAPCRSSFDAAMALVGEHGGVKTHQTLPKDADALAEVLSKQKSRRDRLPDAERTEALSPLPVAELRKYEAVKKAHPDALVCFAQNGYFELYGKDAEKAAPLLGTKLLEKKVRGKPSMPVTGFREAAWVAGSHKLWKSGADVFLSKDGETFKELKAADYIPVGATLNVDGIKCRIDAVDFAADEVQLTNIEDKNRPIRFSESIQYVRSYVEDAGTAIYDTIPKKPAARESIRDKLKSAQKAQPPHTPKPQKSKGKDMEI